MVESVTLTTAKGSATITAKDRPRQAALAGMAGLGRKRDYRIQVTVTTETVVACKDESEAAEIGVAEIEAGDGEIIKRQVAVTYLRPKD